MKQMKKEHKKNPAWQEKGPQKQPYNPNEPGQHEKTPGKKHQGSCGC